MYRILTALQADNDKDLVESILRDDPQLRAVSIGKRDGIPPLDSFDLVVISSDFKGDGISLIPQLLREKVIPILVLTKESAVVNDEHLQILEYSIVDNFSLEELASGSSRHSFFTYRIKVMCKLNLNAFRANIQRSLSGEETTYKSLPEKTTVPTKGFNLKSVVVIGSSAGGPQLVRQILSQLPDRFPPVLVVQHMNYQFSKLFAERLNSSLGKDIRLAKDRETIVGNRVYVAPGGFHLELEKNGSSIVTVLSKGPPVNFVRPSVDVTIFSAVRVYSSNVISIILSGMGSDGREGSRIVRKLGGRVIALRPEDTPVYGMNKSVIESNLAHKVVALREVIPTMMHFLNEL